MSYSTWYSGRLIYNKYNDPWSWNESVVAAYYSDVSWVARRAIQGDPIVGQSVKKVRPRAGLSARGTELVVGTSRAPEVAWILTRPPTKDENGIPIPPVPSGRRYIPPAAKTMIVNGRRMVWNGRSWQLPPTRRVRRGEVWRRWGIPVDTKIHYGPRLPEGRAQARALVERIHSAHGPIIGLDITHASEQESRDLADLLEALNA